MAVEYFLIDAPTAIPQEFAAWEDAKAQHLAIFWKCVEAPDGSAEKEALEEEGRAAKIKADSLEQAARQAWLEKLKNK